MAIPTITFVKSNDTATTLPQAGTSYYDINATDGHGGTSDTPNPLSPSTTGKILRYCGSDSQMYCTAVPRACQALLQFTLNAIG